MIAAYSGNRKVYPAIAASLYSLLEHNEVEKVYLVIEDDAFPYRHPGCAEIVNASGQEYFSKDGPNYADHFPALRMTSICRREGRIDEARAWNAAARKACPQGREWKLDAILLHGAEKSPSA